jgi:transcriptional regulator with XRE-family HTH domain
MSIRKVVGGNIRALREAVGWSQEKLAIRSKLSSDYIGRLERGNANIGIDALSRIAKALKVKEIALFDGD